MRNIITADGRPGQHEVAVQSGEYEDFDERGRPVIRATGHSTWWCTCGAKGAGPNAVTAQEIRAHLGIPDEPATTERA